MTEPTATAHPELEQAAAYALDSLDEVSRRAFEAHLATCPICRAEVAELRAVTEALAFGVPVVEPPPALRERVLAEARASTPREVVEARPRRDRTQVLPWLAAAAAIVVAAGLGWELRRERADGVALVRALAIAETRAEDASRLASARDSLLRVVLSPSASSAKLAATGRAPTVHLVWHRGAAVLVLSATDLQPAPGGRIYQLWGLPESGRPRSLGTFNTGDRGYVVFPAGADVMEAVRVSAVTEEPAGGSPQPTSQPILVGRWN